MVDKIENLGDNLSIVENLLEEARADDDLSKQKHIDEA